MKVLDAFANRRGFLDLNEPVMIAMTIDVTTSAGTHVVAMLQYNSNMP